jgi:hypothetical protein
MSPLFVTAEGRGRSAPTDRARELRKLAQRVDHYLMNHSEELGYGEYADLEELRSRLVAFAELLSARDLDRFLKTEIDMGGEHFGYVKTRAIR